MQGEADAHHYPWSQLNIEQVCPCENSVLAESSQGKVEKLYEVDPVGSPIGSHFFYFYNPILGGACAGVRTEFGNKTSIRYFFIELKPKNFF